MSGPYRKRTALALSLLLIVTGCSSVTERLNNAATVKGQAQAGAQLPPFPDDLRKQEPHAPIVEGQSLISVLARERQALDRANGRQQRTVEFYDDVRAKLSNR